ncbi:alpha-amylase family protein [Halorubrum vacuolatum]|uniref:Maltose alpha-D-glucosyltransferase/ alpha-amylase n=1 Tax=Halorubrum vacuolatum TaxID=63740 RepID=A0A238WB02_HALVU|nr:alpha-amylase family protein [Halorubrum vacuolatum]SNR43765.1 maltose alpha-D-glucosyltransferase/ alpha-amylase [Halorubrum vacuolatum]
MTDPDWYQDATIYSLDIKTFNDADGDGWGDFEGATERLGYLEELGVDALWIRPFYPSPLRDNGYDVADYRDVDDRLGTLADFRAFADAAHDRGMRVLTDLVFNHTSIDHEWFQRAREDPYSAYHDYYLWTSHLEDAHQRGNIFPEYEDGVWSYDDVAGKHYFHQFYHHQPDLNVANPAVREELYDVLRFWLDQGADGFRIDAAHPMLMAKGHNAMTLEDAPGLDEPIDLFKEMRAVVEAEQADAVLLAEADDEPEHLDYYFGDGEAFHLQFNFVMNAHLTYAVGVADTWPLHRAEELLPDVSGVGTWVNFLRNHDEWNLLKLPEEAFEHAREYFGDDEGDSWIFERGHRLRLADLYDGDPDRIAVAHALLFALPGSVALQSGDEIGMGSDLSLPEREAVRTPMQWDDSKNGGFSAADPEACYNPVIDEGQYAYDGVNVADQREDPDSVLSRVRELIAAREASPGIARGHYSVPEADHKGTRVHRFDHEGRVLLCAHNLAREGRREIVGFDVDPDSVEHIVGDGDYHVADGSVTFDLDACGYVWIRGQRR